MKITKVIERVESYIPDSQLIDVQNAINDFLNKLDLHINKKDFYLDLLDYLSGTHTAESESATILTDSSADFPLDNSLIGAKLKNTTDGCEGTITANTATTITVDDLTGGTNNTFQKDDTYEIETRKLSIPDSIISVDKVFYGDSDGTEEMDMGYSLKEYEEDTYYENKSCAIKGRIIYFAEAITPSDVVKLFCSMPHTESNDVITLTTVLDLPDKYLQAMKSYIIKELASMPAYTEKYGYLAEKFEYQHQNDMSALRANKNGIHFSIGTTF
jgi:hypothetical protein